MEHTPAKQRTLRKRDMAVLLAVAVFFDILSLIPGGIVFVGVVGQMVIPFIFSRYGINVFSLKKSVPYIIGFIVEVVPGARLLPAFTLETLIIIYMSK
ncbi:MAG: hypothetical protein RLZZ67_36 [Candidatus Parcubacteria bacterium]|jgi:hypothetical protein